MHNTHVLCLDLLFMNRLIKTSLIGLCIVDSFYTCMLNFLYKLILTSYSCVEKSKFDKIHVLVFGKNVKTQKWFHMLDI